MSIFRMLFLILYLIKKKVEKDKQDGQGEIKETEEESRTNVQELLFICLFIQSINHFRRKKNEKAIC